MFQAFILEYNQYSPLKYGENMWRIWIWIWNLVRVTGCTGCPRWSVTVKFGSWNCIYFLRFYKILLDGTFAMRNSLKDFYASTKKINKNKTKQKNKQKKTPAASQENLSTSALYNDGHRNQHDRPPQLLRGILLMALYPRQISWPPFSSEMALDLGACPFVVC